MRVDKWLSAVNVVKRRTIGDKVTIEYLKGPKSYEVLQIPTTKTIPKSQKEEYVKELSN